MKNTIRLLLQRTLGYQNYLFYFSLFKIYTLKYDRGENDFIHFMNTINQEGIILDIGANIGLMSVSFAKKFPGSQVYAFEPIPYNVEALKRNISFFDLKNVQTFEFALGNTEGEIEMVVPEINNAKMQGLCHVIDQSIPKESTGEKLTTGVRKLDEVEELKNTDMPIVAIKMDVEHFEWAVLEGAKETLAKHKPVIYCELCEGPNKERSFELLKELGYKPQIVVDNQIIEYTPEYKEKTNFIFS